MSHSNMWPFFSLNVLTKTLVIKIKEHKNRVSVAVIWCFFFLPKSAQLASSIALDVKMFFAAGGFVV